LNLRPHLPQRCALPSCATARSSAPCEAQILGILYTIKIKFPNRQISQIAFITEDARRLTTAPFTNAHGYFYRATPESKESAQSVHDEATVRSEEHTSELQSRFDLVCRLL